jgi:hypothetical protein
VDAVEENRSLKGKGLEGDVLSRSLSRRAFLAKLALVAGGSALAMACGAEATATAPQAIANVWSAD